MFRPRLIKRQKISNTGRRKTTSQVGPHLLQSSLFLCHRGVAQLVARAVWDREAEGSSPFTPTI